ncbi:MAG: hypothetical protein AAF192_21410, partial [Pseudomonadota bacterium]
MIWATRSRPYLGALAWAGPLVASTSLLSDSECLAVAGVLLGGAVLFRGIATYLPPFFIMALLWPDDADPWSPQAWMASLRTR